MVALDLTTNATSGTYLGSTVGGQDTARTIPPLYAAVDGATLSTSVTATSLIPAAAKATLPAGYFTVGRTMRITATGRVSNIVTTPGTLTLDVRFGSVVVFTGGAIQLNAAAKTNVTWRFEVLLTCRAVGSGTSANLIGVGTFTSESVVGAAAGTALPITLPATAPAVGTGFDSTVAQTVDLFGTFSISNAANAITVHEFSVE